MIALELVPVGANLPDVLDVPKSLRPRITLRCRKGRSDASRGHGTRVDA